ncbi:MAG: Holliday junction resolvase RuvX [Candidatus Omnitrophica bacterium]|nr:Holliday junction resolvase RuvX [Candidatus Omnitrophota bacterium]
MSHCKPIILCLDIGTKRIGAAKSDALGVAAHALPKIDRTSDAHALSEVERMVREERVDKILMGLPLRTDGKEGGQAVEMVKNFAGQLQKKIRMPIEFWDERFSTAEAERFLIEEVDMPRKKRKSKIDSLAAQIILQSYMNRME